MEQITWIGKINYRNENQVFGIKGKDRLGHIYCIGKTGAGKSTLLLNMAISDILNGNGIGVIDPHGDLSESILEYIPDNRIEDVIYFNACDSQFPIAFNPFNNIKPTERHIVVSGLVYALKRIWAESWGPRMEHILRNSLQTLTYFPKATLLDIQPLLTQHDFRKNVLTYVTDQALIDFWQNEFQNLTPALKAETISPIVNKIGLFQTHALLRNIIGQESSVISIADIMDNKKIFVVNLSKGALGEDATQLLGSIIIALFQTAALTRSNKTIEARVPFYLYIDEMHSFITLSFANILSEARKYGLCLFLTHQYLDQLHEDIRKAIFGNVGTMISFRIGANDAEILKPEFNSLFEVEDFIRLPLYHIYLKLLIDGTTSEPFSAITLPITSNKYGLRYKIINYSRRTYANKKLDVEYMTKNRREGVYKNLGANLFN